MFFFLCIGNVFLIFVLYLPFLTFVQLWYLSILKMALLTKKMFPIFFMISYAKHSIAVQFFNSCNRIVGKKNPVLIFLIHPADKEMYSIFFYFYKFDLSVFALTKKSYWMIS